MENFIIKRNAMHQWIIVHPLLAELAWSGSRWVEIDKEGRAHAGIEPCNFSTATEAAQCAEMAEESHGPDTVQ